MSVTVVFFTILVLLVIAVIMSISGWFFQSSISSRIALMEKELEEKLLEFDALRKERGESKLRADDLTDEEDLPHMTGQDDQLTEQTIGEGEIQIIRNVRGSYEEEAADATHDVEPDALQNPRHLSSFESAPSVQSDLSPIDALPSGKEHAAPQEDAAESLPQSPSPYAEPDYPAETFVPLFSPELQGPDLERVYNSLLAIMEAGQPQAVALDCAGISDLSGEEQEYLLQVYSSLVGQGHTLSFVNCPDTLSAQLLQSPYFAALVR